MGDELNFLARMCHHRINHGTTVSLPSNIDPRKQARQRFCTSWGSNTPKWNRGKGKKLILQIKPYMLI
jgi:hypothetical protein